MGVIHKRQAQYGHLGHNSQIFGKKPTFFTVSAYFCPPQGIRLGGFALLRAAQTYCAKMAQ